ncbi:GntR family transcriptional regulator [Siccirubricoccus sp. KC 17139]|uniref:GntR family transcriptional regulator n=1 Tax=Siccirubricoccus soli TaxID=2899147 RepID=A0ABT1DB67_9PROT|nr:GntR family transcriptional regulator [Siccirubricoccus soli]MCO6419183.1 GntR family transcriptional regulator [Siccirubricoccus soli]MCP2685318.1 GntR family transcriptional regulator [Siccirubricoccus soli]
MASDAALQVEPLAEEETLSLGERAYRRLRASIVQGALAPGAKISERGLANALGISAQPVREALRRLEQDGLVVTLPRRGTVVAEIGPERLAELGRIRAALEGVAAALAAERMSEADLAELRQVVRRMRAATAAADHEALAEANERFHALIQGATGNLFLIRSLEALHAFDEYGRPRALGSTPNALPRALREHAGILAALRARDPALAETRMRAHVLRSLVTNRVLAPPARARRGKSLTPD